MKNNLTPNALMYQRIQEKEKQMTEKEILTNDELKNNTLEELIKLFCTIKGIDVIMNNEVHFTDQAFISVEHYIKDFISIVTGFEELYDPIISEAFEIRCVSYIKSVSDWINTRRWHKVVIDITNIITHCDLDQDIEISRRELASLTKLTDETFELFTNVPIEELEAYVKEQSNMSLEEFNFMINVVRDGYKKVCEETPDIKVTEHKPENTFTNDEFAQWLSGITGEDFTKRVSTDEKIEVDTVGKQIAAIPLPNPLAKVVVDVMKSRKEFKESRDDKVAEHKPENVSTEDEFFMDKIIITTEKKRYIDKDHINGIEPKTAIPLPNPLAKVVADVMKSRKEFKESRDKKVDELGFVPGEYFIHSEEERKKLIMGKLKQDENGNDYIDKDNIYEIGAKISGPVSNSTPDDVTFTCVPYHIRHQLPPIGGTYDGDKFPLIQWSKEDLKNEDTIRFHSRNNSWEIQKDHIIKPMIEFLSLFGIHPHEAIRLTKQEIPPVDKSAVKKVTKEEMDKMSEDVTKSEEEAIDRRDDVASALYAHIRKSLTEPDKNVVGNGVENIKSQNDGKFPLVSEKFISLYYKIEDSIREDLLSSEDGSLDAILNEIRSLTNNGDIQISEKNRLLEVIMYYINNDDIIVPYKIKLEHCIRFLDYDGSYTEIDGWDIEKPAANILVYDNDKELELDDELLEVLAPIVWSPLYIQQYQTIISHCNKVHQGIVDVRSVADEYKKFSYDNSYPKFILFESGSIPNSSINQNSNYIRMPRFKNKRGEYYNFEIFIYDKVDIHELYTIIKTLSTDPYHETGLAFRIIRYFINKIRKMEHINVYLQLGDTRTAEDINRELVGLGSELSEHISDIYDIIQSPLSTENDQGVYRYLEVICRITANHLDNIVHQITSKYDYTLDEDKNYKFMNLLISYKNDINKIRYAFRDENTHLNGRPRFK